MDDLRNPSQRAINVTCCLSDVRNGIAVLNLVIYACLMQEFVVLSVVDFFLSMVMNHVILDERRVHLNTDQRDQTISIDQDRHPSKRIQP